MNNVKYIIGSDAVNRTPLPIYNEAACAFISEISSALMKSPLIRAFPDLSALAFWGRKANLQKLKNEFGDTAGRLGKGLCLHIAPSNIPVNFAFTYFFGLLSGNANIVRLPSQSFPQIDFLCSLFSDILQHFSTIQERTAFVRYPRNDKITAELSKIADARMIWGGDETIKAVRSLPVKPRCTDITFADRYSVCLLNASAINNASENEIKRLAENFYNDTYLMDQNACSSPQLILWKNDNKNAREKFWNAVFEISQKKYSLQDAVAVDKYTQLCEESILNTNMKSVFFKSNLLYREEIKCLNTDIINHRGKGGYFYEYNLTDINELFDVITEKFQTITYFGIDPISLRNAIIMKHICGIDRIVPVGKAVDISVLWDGHDLIRELSRYLVCQ